MHAESLQSCLTLCDSMDCSLPGSSAHGILQVRILEWVAMPSSRRFSGPRDPTHISCIFCTAGGFFTAEPKGSACQVASVVSDSMRPHRWQPTRLCRPWDSPGKNTGVGCHFLLQCMKVKSENEVAQSCPTLRDPMDCSLPGSSIHGFSRQDYWSGVPSLSW